MLSPLIIEYAGVPFFFAARVVKGACMVGGGLNYQVYCICIIYVFFYFNGVCYFFFTFLSMNNATRTLTVLHAVTGLTFAKTLDNF